MADFSFVRSASNQADPASATLAGTPTEGNLLVAVAADRSGGDASTFTISGTGWSKPIARTIQQSDGSYRRTLVGWWKVAGASEPTNVQVDDGTGNTKSLLVAEYAASVAGTWALAASVSNDNGAVSNGASVSAGSTGSVSAADNLLIGLGGWKQGGHTSSFTPAWTSAALVNDATLQGDYFGRGLAIGSLKDTTSGAKTTTLGVSSSDISNDGLAAALLVFAFTASGGGGGVTLTDVDGDEAFASNATGVSFTGTGMGASSGDRTFSLVQGATVVTQTQGSGNATSGTFSVTGWGTGGLLKYGVSTSARVTVGADTANLSVTVSAPSGNGYVDLGTPNTTAANRLTSSADLASGDQVEWGNLQGTGTVVVNDDGTFDASSTITAFDFRVQDGTGWGAWETQTLADPAEAPTLSSATPSGTLGTQTTATVGATTNQSSGTLYTVVDTAANLSGVTASQVIAGQKASGSAALKSGTATISTTSPSVSTTGLTANTAYAYRVVQVNGNGTSNMLSGTFTTAVATATVPNVVNQTQASATSAITGAGLTLGTVSNANHASIVSGNVISQSPSAGSTVTAGSAVNITVSLGPVMVSVPNVVNQTQSAASAAITGAGLTVGTITNASHASVPSGSVISQSPSAGSSAAEGSAVNLTVSTGPTSVTVPNIVGATQASAVSSITGASLTVGSISSAYSGSVATGNVISQSPAAGSSAPEGSAVDFVVSLGTAPASTKRSLVRTLVRGVTRSVTNPVTG